MTALIILLALVACFLLFVSMQPGDFKIERSRVIKASPESIFPHMNDFRNWPAWSPWIEMEPSAVMTYGDKSEGEGGTYRWDGKKTGAGRCTILRSVPHSNLDVALEFEKPMKASNRADFSLAPEGDSTRVTWTMTGTNDLIGKAFGLLMNMDKVVVGQFDRGLEKMAQLVEN